jgi:hypothetical protein
MSRAADSRIPSSPRSQRATLFAVTPTSAASPACETLSRFRSRHTSPPVTGRSIRYAYGCVNARVAAPSDPGAEITQALAESWSWSWWRRWRWS